MSVTGVYGSGEEISLLKSTGHRTTLVTVGSTLSDEADARMVKVAQNGESTRSIAEGVPWTHPTVAKILKREEEYRHTLGGRRLGHQLKTTVCNTYIHPLNQICQHL